MIKILFSVYIALLLTKIFPFPTPVSALVLFVILTIIIFLFLSQAKIFKKAKRFSSREMILAVLMIGLLCTILLALLPDGQAGSKIALFDKLPVQVQQIFISKYSLFAWLSLPLIALALIRKIGKDKE